MSRKLLWISGDFYCHRKWLYTLPTDIYSLFVLISVVLDTVSLCSPECLLLLNWYNLGSSGNEGTSIKKMSVILACRQIYGGIFLVTDWHWRVQPSWVVLPLVSGPGKRANWTGKKAGWSSMVSPSIPPQTFALTSLGQGDLWPEVEAKQVLSFPSSFWAWYLSQ